MSGNLDGPEGGFDAMMQAVVCNVRTFYKLQLFLHLPIKASSLWWHLGLTVLNNRFLKLNLNQFSRIYF